MAFSPWPTLMLPIRFPSRFPPIHPPEYAQNIRPSNNKTPASTINFVLNDVLSHMVGAIKLIFFCKIDGKSPVQLSDFDPWDSHSRRYYFVKITVVLFGSDAVSTSASVRACAAFADRCHQ